MTRLRLHIHLFCFLSNATGLILDLEGDTEVTSTSDLSSSKEPSWVMGRAAACQPWAALPVPPSRTGVPVILKQIFPLAYVSVLVAGILRPPAIWQRLSLEEQQEEFYAIGTAGEDTNALNPL